MKNNNLYVSILVILLAAAGFVFVLRRHVDAPAVATSDAGSLGMGGMSGASAASASAPSAASSGDLAVNFQCDSGKSIAAVFHLSTTQGADLALSDGRTMSLSHVQADGMDEYASADGSVILWSKGQGTFLQEGNQTTYSNCAVASAPMTGMNMDATGSGQ